MLYAREFEAEDLEAINPIETGLRTDAADALAKQQSWMNVTAIKDGKVMGCGGVIPLGYDVGELWIALDLECQNCPVDTVRWLKNGLQIIIENYGLRRLQALVRSDFPRGIRLLEYLKFEHEGTLKNYFPECDGLLYGMVLED